MKVDLIILGSLLQIKEISCLTYSSLPHLRNLHSSPRVLPPCKPNNRAWHGHRRGSYHTIVYSSGEISPNECDNRRRRRLLQLSKTFTVFTPLWTLIATAIGVKFSQTVSSTLGGMKVVQFCLATLMLSMGLSIKTKDFTIASKKLGILLYNLVLCFIMMPAVSIGMSKAFQYSSSQTSGIVLLGCVSGGQASNLFTMIAGGDVALSILCTLTSTLVGVIATPFLIKLLLGTVVFVDSIAVLKSVASLVLVPLTIGLTIGNLADDFTTKISCVYPVIGVLSTLVLCAGGAANSALLLGGYDALSVLASCLLPIIGGVVALIFTKIRPFHKMTSTSRRALVIETLSKSPTLAYVLALKHFDDAAKIPAAGMVSLAVIGALVASIWSMKEPKQ